jgi:hypothetical protein
MRLSGCEAAIGKAGDMEFLLEPVWESRPGGSSMNPMQRWHGFHFAPILERMGPTLPDTGQLRGALE